MHRAKIDGKFHDQHDGAVFAPGSESPEESGQHVEPAMHPLLVTFLYPPLRNYQLPTSCNLVIHDVHFGFSYLT
jgi:hypothetical protein